MRVIKGTENLGVFKIQDALQLAKKEELDLILIAEEAKPPVAKILDFNKFLYEERKKESQAKARSKKSTLKEFRIRPSIGGGELNSRVERGKEFILRGDRVRVTVQLRGREMAYPQLGFEKIEKFSEGISEVAAQEKAPEQKGHRISVVFVKK